MTNTSLKTLNESWDIPTHPSEIPNRFSWRGQLFIKLQLESIQFNQKVITTAWKCSHSEFFCSVFSQIRTKYREIRSISPYSVRVRRNTDQKNSEYGHFTNSDLYRYFQDLVLMIFYWFWMLRTQSWNLGDVHPSSIGIWKSRVKKPSYVLWRHKTEFHNVQVFFVLFFSSVFSH